MVESEFADLDDLMGVTASAFLFGVATFLFVEPTLVSFTFSGSGFGVSFVAWRELFLGVMVAVSATFPFFSVVVSFLVGDSELFVRPFEGVATVSVGGLK